MKKFLVIAACLSVCACTNAPKATSALEDAGYTNIETHGHAFLACAESDTYATKFTATGPTGRPVSGAVCSGMFKNSTIRLD